MSLGLRTSTNLIAFTIAFKLFKVSTIDMQGIQKPLLD
jgi:hypothetical protein